MYGFSHTRKSRHVSRKQGQASYHGTGPVAAAKPSTDHSTPKQKAKPAQPQGHTPAPRHPKGQKGQGVRVLGPEEHGITANQLSKRVLEIARKLAGRGHTTYLVGGAVRDLLLGRQPKDFDLATSARPEHIKALFHNARIIGRRFKLVHLEYPETTIELATFRSGETVGTKGHGRHQKHATPRWGTAEEDAQRRDFTINALMMDPQTLEVLDHVGAMEDLRAKRIRMIAPVGQSLAEDPVRMLRAIRFKVRLGFELETELAKLIPVNAYLLNKVSRHRLADELRKFMDGGKAPQCFAEFEQQGVLGPLLGVGALGHFATQKAHSKPLPLLQPVLRAADRWGQHTKEPLTPTVALLAILMALAHPEDRELLQAPPSRQDHDRLGSMLYNRLAPVLGDWGLLNGQVQPALRILGMTRQLLRRGGQSVERDAHPRGSREAQMLLILLAELMQLEEDELWDGWQHVVAQKPLPILDHHRLVQRFQLMTGLVDDVPRSRRTRRPKERSRSKSRPAPGRRGVGRR